MAERVRLEPLRDEDSDRLFAWINDRELVVLSAPFRPVERAAHDAWFDAVRRRDDTRIFGIRVGDELIGSCQLHSIHDGSAELQIRIGERVAQGRGYGSEAVRLLLRHAYGELGLRQVRLHVLASNERALALYRRAGFAELRGDEVVEVNGRKERVIRMVRPHVVAIHQPNFFPWLGLLRQTRACGHIRAARHGRVLQRQPDEPRRGAGRREPALDHRAGTACRHRGPDP